ncbi:MAG: HAMP domain-containing protein [Phycisphaerae bacterium]|nr:HAMP domain-containing protein [Phycisphaerae bacterium]
MSLQRRLTYLLTAFAAFALAATFGTIYGIQLHVDDAMIEFQRSLDQAHWLAGLSIDLRDYELDLRGAVEGRWPVESGRLDRWMSLAGRLEEASRYVPETPAAARLAELTEQFEDASGRCVAALRAGQAPEAETLYATIAQDTLPDLEDSLRALTGLMDSNRNASLGKLVATQTQILWLSLLIGVSGAALVAVGVALIRRWIMLPLRDLHRATLEFGQGRLDHRVQRPGPAELGALGRALNHMADSLLVAEADLRMSEAKYRSLFENLRDAAILCDGEGRVLECHDGDTHLLGPAVPGSMGRAITEVWPHWSEADLDWKALISQVLRDDGQVRRSDVPLPREEEADEAALVDLIAYPVVFGSRRCVAIILRDVTERARLERKVRQAETMEATVTFARGVAHDFNNLLTSAIGSLSLMREKLGEGLARRRLERALQASWQAARLSRKLLSFASRGPGRPEVLSLPETVRLILDSLDEEFLREIRLHVDTEDTAPVRIDRDQLTQIVLNLVINAREAMPEGGDLCVSVRPARPPADRPDTGPPTHALLSVSDTGCGLSPDARRHLFEPFYTTRQGTEGRRRGMGLAIVFAAVQGAGGFIDVESELGAGTRFHVYLPLCSEAPVAAPRLVPRAAVDHQGHGHILVVDDESPVLELCVDALSSWGYSVVAARSGREAEQAAAGRPDGTPFALALLDLGLPDADGLEVARRLVALDSRLRIILSTGLDERVLPADLEPYVCAQLVKPFHLSALAAAVSAAMETHVRI